MSSIVWLEDNNYEFPPVEQALSEPDGLLAAGGLLSPEILLKAYRRGIFPWYSQGQPILWWSPDPRCVLFPKQLKISRSLRKTLNKKPFEVRQDTAFREVMLNCARPRKDDAGTWITREMLQAYCRMHELGYAHSVECWQNDKLVGGLYGMAIGSMFFGESMFSHRTDASKVALEYLCNTMKPKLIDVQVYSKHMESLGARMIPRARFIQLLKNYMDR
ncbi:MAG: leucyl/phenylalanyl-tRNA--protein transferase [Gammaproteobacteria bacterium]|nr:leucyl/phenylalanyl-tRNA--protein transferase [Gammaproteobacteria bacterium]